MITVTNGSAIKTPRGATYVNFAVSWGLNGTFGSAIPDSLVPAPSVNLDVNAIVDARSFGVVRGVMVDNSKCRSPVVLLAYATGWTVVCRPLRTTVVNVDSNTTGLLVSAPGGTMGTDVTTVTLSNVRASAREFRDLGIPGQHTNSKTFWWNVKIDMSGASSTTHCFAGDAIVDHMDVDVQSMTCTGAGAATLALVSRQAGVGTFLSIPLLYSNGAGISTDTYKKLFKLRKPLYANGGMDAVWTNAATITGQITIYGNYL